MHSHPRPLSSSRSLNHRSAVAAGICSVLVAATALLAMGCSDDAAPASVANDGGNTPGDGGTSESGATQAAQNVLVVYKTSEVAVDVTTLARQDYKGSPVVTLTKVWEASKLSAELGKLEFDFEADDGFRPAASARCKDLSKITGAQLGQGYVLPETRTLVWDEALGLPGCFSVKFVAKVLATDKP